MDWIRITLSVWCVLLSTLWSSFDGADGYCAAFTIPRGVVPKAKDDHTKYYCPKYSFVSNFIIKKHKEGGVIKDYSFYLECDFFTPPDFDDDAPERCIVRFKWTMGGYDLRMDDHFKSCSCDEYLAGIKTNYTEGKRIVQFRCCHAKNKIHNITGCYFTGQRDLKAEWPTEVRIKKGMKVPEGIQTFAIIDDHVIGRVCPYFTKDIEIDSIEYMTNHCWGVKQRNLLNMMMKLKKMATECKIYMGSPFGWPQKTNSLSNDKNMEGRKEPAATNDRLYENQETKCKDGSYLYAFYKWPKVGDKGKDYIFLTRCHVLVYTVCSCSWKQNCTKPEKRNTSESNKTIYVAGWKSEWDEENGRREFKLWCCKSDGLKMHYCNLTKNYTDADTSLVIARPRYKFMAFLIPKCIDGQIIRDVDHWYKNGILQLRFNICNINGSQGECEKPCPKGCEGDMCKPPIPVVVVPVPINSAASTTTTPYISTSTTTTPTTTPPKCRIDVNFLLDSSFSLGQKGFDEEKEFIRGFVASIPLSQDLNRVALTEFGSSMKQEWTFTNTQQTNANIDSRIDDLTWWGENTCITCALQASIPLFQNNHRQLGNGQCVPQVAILVTDGRNNVGADPDAVAQQLRDSGVTLYAVGAGPEADPVQLEQITGDASKVFLSPLDNLKSIVQKVVDAACAQKSVPCP